MIAAKRPRLRGSAARWRSVGARLPVWLARLIATCGPFRLDRAHPACAAQRHPGIARILRAPLRPKQESLSVTPICTGHHHRSLIPNVFPETRRVVMAPCLFVRAGPLTASRSYDDTIVVAATTVVPVASSTMLEPLHCVLQDPVKKV